MLVEWQWDQLRVMKVGGNESATKFFQQNGGTAALNSKDPKTKYESSAATKYKDELKRRAARDAKEWVISLPDYPPLCFDAHMHL
jgi:ADP-ribosylation factor GTPase-activating protein 2/3